MATPDPKHREAEETTARGDEDTGAQADHREAEETTAGNDEDTGAQIAPIVKLEEVAITTGEEEEDAIVDLKAKLYRFDKEGNQWKERGAGTVKLLRHRETGKVRLVMRQSKTLKICANHLVGPTMSVQEYLRNDRACIWHAADFSDGELKDEFFCMSSLGMEDMVRKATTEKEDLRLQLDQQRTMKNQLKLDIVLKDVQLQSYADVVSARDKEIVDLKQKVLCLQNSEAKAKEAGAMEYKKSQGFTDSMTIYFFEGFEAFRRRSMAAYPGVDFKIFEADDDLQSLIAGEEGGASVIDDGISKGKPSHVVDEKVGEPKK